ncbi:hypothetical protein GH714_015307 [Hevea brasiliensis]|uniref:AB hydrolase-1 domain-containing protein n=1 Tax=Hevea brasiliensis TaxID=3981 RepID=A0A6A6KP37_HEVBR|nr:hypothetical protein GH714_015307 [Hevea brasiliensis]
MNRKVLLSKELWLLGFQSWVLLSEPVKGLESLPYSQKATIIGHGGVTKYIIYNIPELAKRYKVYALDLLGFGWSEKAIIEYDAMYGGIKWAFHEVYINTSNVDSYLVESITRPAADPNAGEVYYRFSKSFRLLSIPGLLEKAVQRVLPLTGLTRTIGSMENNALRYGRASQPFSANSSKQRRSGYEPSDTETDWQESPLCDQNNSSIVGPPNPKMDLDLRRNISPMRHNGNFSSKFYDSCPKRDSMASPVRRRTPASHRTRREKKMVDLFHQLQFVEMLVPSQNLSI